MRTSDLLTKPVLDPSGAVVGHVADLRLVQDGPPIGQWGAAFRVHGLVVTHGFGPYLGYDRSAVRRPWLLDWLLNLLHRNARYAEWHQVAGVGPDGVRLAVPMDALPRVPEV